MSAKITKQNQAIGKSILAVFFIGITANLSGCSLNQQNNIAQAEDKPTLVVSHDVICDFITAIAEDTLDLTCLIDGTQSPHTYRPTPSDRKAIEEAQVILYGGYQLEPKIIPLLETNEDSEESLPKLAVYEQVVSDPILGEHEHEHEHEEEEKHTETEATATSPEEEELQPDPHVWHNVENAVAMVELIQPLATQLNPTNVELYLRNSVALTEKLWQLDAWIDEQIATIPEGKRVLVTTHNSLNYYVRAYQLEDYKSLQGLSSESSPTASQLRELATQVRQLGIPTIFAESTANDRVISNVAREAGVKLSPQRLYADGLGDTDNYFEMMVSNTCAIVDGLGGKCSSFE